MHGLDIMTAVTRVGLSRTHLDAMSIQLGSCQEPIFIRDIITHEYRRSASKWSMRRQTPQGMPLVHPSRPGFNDLMACNDFQATGQQALEDLQAFISQFRGLAVMHGDTGIFVFDDNAGLGREMRVQSTNQSSQACHRPGLLDDPVDMANFCAMQARRRQSQGGNQLVDDAQLSPRNDGDRPVKVLLQRPELTGKVLPNLNKLWMWRDVRQRAIEVKEQCIATCE